MGGQRNTRLRTSSGIARTWDRATKGCLGIWNPIGPGEMGFHSCVLVNEPGAPVPEPASILLRRLYVCSSLPQCERSPGDPHLFSASLGSRTAAKPAMQLETHPPTLALTEDLKRPHLITEERPVPAVWERFQNYEHTSGRTAVWAVPFSASGFLRFDYSVGAAISVQVLPVYGT